MRNFPTKMFELKTKTLNFSFFKLFQKHFYYLQKKKALNLTKTIIINSQNFNSWP